MHIRTERLNCNELSRFIDMLQATNADYVPPLETIVDICQYAEKLLKHSIVLTAMANGEDVGFIAFYANDEKNKTAYISTIGVLPSARGLSIGKDLLNTAEKHCRERKMLRIQLEVSDQNIPALSLYENAGFKKKRNPQNQSYSSAIFMEKKI